MNATLKITVYFIAFITLLTIQGCDSKPQNTPAINDLTEAKNNNWKISGLKGGNESIGVRHNRALDAITKIENFKDRNSDDVFNVITKEMPAEYEMLKTIFETKGDGLQSFIRSQMSDMKNGIRLCFQPLSDKKGVSDFDSAKHQVFANLIDFEDIKEGVIDGKLDPMKESYNELYSSLQANSRLSTNEKTQLCSTLEILFYSKVYWADVAADPTNKWNAELDKIVAGEFKDYFGFEEPETPAISALKGRFGGKWWRWLIVAAADAFGAFGGAVIGGGLLGPVGLPAGAMIVGGLVSGEAIDYYSKLE